jgi:hypothetical protein
VDSTWRRGLRPDHDHGGQIRPAAPDRRAERAGAGIDLELDLALTGGRREGLVAEDRELQAGVVSVSAATDFALLSSSGSGG